MLEALIPIVKTAAREELLSRFTATRRRYKNDGSIVTEADLAMQQRLTRDLAARFPEYPLLGEEMSEAEQIRLLAAGDAGLWVLDPLDGTSNYAANLPFFGVSLALLVARRPVLGLVYDPTRDECFTAEVGKGAWLNGVPLHCRPVDLPLEGCLAVVDFKRIPQHAAALAKRPPYSSQRCFGSVVLEWCWLAANRCHLYLHGRQKLWDYAAGALILAEAGGYAETLEGEPIFADIRKPRSVLAATEASLFARWKDWLERHRSPVPCSPL